MAIKNEKSNTTAGQSGDGVIRNSSSSNTGLSTGTAAATARGFYEQAKETAGQAYEAVTEKTVENLDEKKKTLAGGLSALADGLRQAGTTVEGQASENDLNRSAAKYVSTAAKKLEVAASYFERKDAKEVMSDIETFARQNPAIFLGAAFGLGILAARFLKSSADGRNYAQMETPQPQGLLESSVSTPDQPRAGGKNKAGSSAGSSAVSPSENVINFGQSSSADKDVSSAKPTSPGSGGGI